MNIATIWGHDRNVPTFHTHHSFWDATLVDMGHAVHHYVWSEIHDMPRSHDAYFFIDFNPILLKLEKGIFKNSVFYWNDSFHFTFAYVAQACERFDRAYMAERGSSEHLSSLGYKISWLPAAFYPGFYRRIPNSRKIHDYAFIGQQDSAVYRKGDTRFSLLSSLSRLPGLHGYVGQGIYGPEVNVVYNESKILFDRTIWYNIGTRLFETVGSGGFCLMNQLPEFSNLKDIGEDGVHFVVYDDSFPDFEKKLKYYLAHDEEREKIADAGRAHFLWNHTYKNRIEVVFKDLGLVS